MAKGKISIPPVSDEFRRTYQSEYACIPIEWEQRISILPDETAGGLLKAILRHCKSGSTTPPEGMDAFAFGLILDRIDEYQEKGLEFAWRRAYIAGYASEQRWSKAGNKEGAQDNAQESSRMHKDAQESHNNISTPTSTLTPTPTFEKENTNTNLSREKTRDNGGEVGSSFSGDSRVPELKQYFAYCKKVLIPFDFADDLWLEMQNSGWTYEKDGVLVEIQKWQKFVDYRARRAKEEEKLEPTTADEIDSRAKKVYRDYIEKKEINLREFIYCLGMRPEELEKNGYIDY